ncbi:MAG: element excision factor XisH family protein [Saprospiraceae bacterium]
MAKDLYHDAVKNALIKAGWKISNEPFYLRIDDEHAYFIDILAEKWIIARKSKEWLFVEVKSFIAKSDAYELHSSVGQYLIYRAALKYLKIKKRIVLAVPIEVYANLFQSDFVQFVMEEYDIELLPYDPFKEVLI